MLERGLCVAMGSLSIGGGSHDSLVMLKVAPRFERAFSGDIQRLDVARTIMLDVGDAKSVVKKNAWRSLGDVIRYFKLAGVGGVVSRNPHELLHARETSALSGLKPTWSPPSP